jgi:hypothetical protein
MRGNVRRISRGAHWLALVVLAIAAGAAPAQARVVTLRWLDGEPQPSPIVSFRVHHGTSPGVYDATIDVGLPTPDVDGVRAYDLVVADDADVYVAMTAWDGSLESPYSNELFYPAPAPTPDPTPDPDPTPTPDPDPPLVDVTSAAGLDVLQLALSDPPSSEETVYMTGGAAAGDYDGDGFPDLYVTRLDAPDSLYRNLRDGSFEDVSVQAGLDLDLPSNGAAWGDIDNDGDLDLYVTTLGPDATRFYLFVNDGNGVFSEEAVARNAAIAGADPHYGQSVAFGDFDADGWLDIHTTEWRPSELDPTGSPSNARLLRNRGDAAPGVFEDVTVSAGVVLDGPGGVFALSSRFADLDADGRPDLLVVGDGGASRLFWNNGDGTFSDGTDAAGVGTEENGTGSAVGDVDGDGDLDWFVTGIYHPDDPCADPAAGCGFGASGNRLYANAGNRSFVDATDSAGVRDGYWGTAAALYDIDADGDLDLVETNGANVPFLSAPDDEPFARFDPDPLRVWLNDGAGRATERSAELGMLDEGAGRALVTFDYDLDGDLDLFVVNNAAAPTLYRNDLAGDNGWLRVNTLGTESNRAGIGAVVSVWLTQDADPQIREIEAGSHYLGQSESTAHFGLGSGSAPVHRVEVYWPATGRTTGFSDVARNSEILAIEPVGQVLSAGAPEPAATTATAPAEPSSEPGSACGLLGVEPLAVLWWRRRRRGLAPRAG